jgi:hypothetical protein
VGYSIVPSAIKELAVLIGMQHPTFRKVSKIKTPPTHLNPDEGHSARLCAERLNWSAGDLMVYEGDELDREMT